MHQLIGAGGRNAQRLGHQFGMPMAVYTFLEHYDLTGKTIHPFCTHEGSGLSRTVQDVQKAASGATVTKGLAIRGSSVDGAKDALEKWVKEVG